VPDTSRLKWPYPDAKQSSWFDTFVSMLGAMDASVYSALESRNDILTTEGTVTWDASTNTLTWASALILRSAITAGLWSVPAGSLAVGDGQLLAVTLTPGPLGTVTASLTAVSSISGASGINTDLILALRSGSRLWFRNGWVLQTGTYTPGLLTPPTSTFVAELQVGGTQVVTGAMLGAWRSHGTIYLDPAVYGLSLQSLLFKAEGRSGADGYVGSVRVKRLPAGAPVVEGTVTINTAALARVSLALPIQTAAWYEVEVSSTNTGLITDTFELTRASITVRRV